MIEVVKSVIRDKCGLNPDEPVLVGLSGGADSLVLLDILRRLGYQLVAAHLDHGMRSDSGDDTASVKNMVNDLGVEFTHERVNVVEYAGVHHLSLEEAGRSVRYQFLFQQAAQFGAQAVLVGHNADDQVETVLMHLMRGSGLSGLRGMLYWSLPNAWSEDIPLVRPLLGTWREEIQDYVEEQELQPLDDPSNLDTRYYRNRLRHELIPYLQDYNPQVKKLFWRMALTLSDDYDVLTARAAQAWDVCLFDEGPDYVGFSRAGILALPMGVQRHLFRRAISHLRPDLRDIDFNAIQRGLDFVQAPSRSGECDLLAGLWLKLEGDMLWLSGFDAELPVAQWPQVLSDRTTHLPVPGMLRLKDGWMLRAESEVNIEAGRAEAISNADPYLAWIDAADISLPLQVRARRAGDRFRPLGMAGHSIKLSDFLVNEKLTRRARENWPLVVSGDDIVWVVGYRPAHPFRVRADTQKIVRLNVAKSQ